MKNVKIIHTAIRGNYRINTITSPDAKTKVIATPIKGSRAIHEDSRYAPSIGVSLAHCTMYPLSIMREYYHEKINPFKSLDEMAPCDRDFTVIHIYADWKLDIKSKFDFTVAQKILLNSLMNN